MIARSAVTPICSRSIAAASLRDCSKALSRARAQQRGAGADAARQNDVAAAEPAATASAARRLASARTTLLRLRFRAVDLMAIDLSNRRARGSFADSCTIA